MERSIYPDGVLVDQEALKFTESSKAEQIVRTRVDITSGGVETGGAVTVNGVNTDRVDVAAFTGYTPRGDYTTATLANTNIAMSDSTNGVVNLIIAMYTESNTKSSPHENNSTTYPTRAVASYRMVAYTETEYAALSATDDNLANDSVDRALILAKVTANGTGVALTSGSITSPSVFSGSFYANPSTPTAFGGVDITAVDPTSGTGTGLLEYQYSSPNYQLRWTSPGGTVGSWVSWTVDDVQNVADGSGYYLTVSLSTSQAPTTGTFPLTENIVIVDLYGQAIPRQTAEDEMHRSLRGTGIVSATNPHGSSITDISGETNTFLDEHQDVMHCNGIYRGSSANTLSTSVSPGAGYDTLVITPPSTGDLFYVNGIKQTEIDTTSIVFNFPSNVTHMYEVYVSDEGAVGYTDKAAYPGSRTVTGTWIVNMSNSYPASTYSLQCVATSGAPNSYTFTWDGGASVVVQSAQPDQSIRLYAEDGVNWIDLWVRTTALGATDAHLPAVGATYTDTITVNASPTWSDNLHIANVPYWWDSVSPQGVLGYEPYNVPRLTVDRRSWGNLGKYELSDDALNELSYQPTNEYNYSGVVLNRDTYSASINSFEMTTTAGSLNVEIVGGHAYVRGERFSVTNNTALVLTASVTNLIYVDTDGVIQSLNVTTDFAGVINDALEFIMGPGTDRPNTSDVYHPSLSSIGPERGTPLYWAITDATQVTDYEDIMRNIHNVGDPWSVGSTRNLAFSSLEAAFYHAGIYADQEVTVRLMGNSSIPRRITQTSNVKVVGVGDSTVAFTYRDTTSGSWVLSTGCVVEDVNFQKSYTVAEGGVLFGVADNVTIQGCNFSCRGALVFADNGAATISNVRFERNYGQFRSLTSVVDFTGSTNSNWSIKDNTLLGYSNSTENGIIQLALTDSHITGNSFSLENSGGITPAIYQDSPSGLIISDNSILISDGAGSAEETGVIIEGTASNVVITDTIIKPTSTSVSNIKIGIVLDADFTNIKVTDNVFNDLAIGVYGSTSFEGETIDISNNNLSNMNRAGIHLAGTAGNTSNLSIKGNNIYNILNASNPFGWTSTLGIGVKLTGAYYFTNITIDGNSIYNSSTTAAGNAHGVILESDTSPTLVENASVSNNQIRGVSSINNNAYGINLQCLGTTPVWDSIKCDSNQITEITSDGAYEQQAININGSSLATDVGVFSASSNKIEFTSSVGTADAGESTGIDCSIGVVSGTFNDNVITINGGSSYKGEGIDLTGTSSGPVTVTGNSIFNPNSVAIYNFFDDAVISNNTIETDYAGIYSIKKALITSNSIQTNSVGIVSNGDYSVVSNNNVDLTAAYASAIGLGCTGSVGINNVGDYVKIDGNAVTLSPATANIPVETAMIWSNGLGMSIDNNKTSILADITTVGGGLPTANNAYHIYMLVDEPSGSINSTYSLQSNFIDNVTNLSAAMLSGIYLDEGGTPADLRFIQVTNNNIRDLSTDGAFPTTGITAVTPAAYFENFASGLNISVVGSNLFLVVTGSSYAKAVFGSGTVTLGTNFYNGPGLY